jgi:predicted RNA-binding Zn-ribbon protein involved in translation (DUF1610 family)
MDCTCPFCGDVMTCWARGRYALRLCFGAGAEDDRWEVWRCPTCGLVTVFRCAAASGAG